MGESFFATLECELLERRRFASQAEAKMACFSFIEGWYNPVRRHSALDCRSPIAYEAIMDVVATEPYSTKPSNTPRTRGSFNHLHHAVAQFHDVTAQCLVEARDPTSVWDFASANFVLTHADGRNFRHEMDSI